MIPLRCRHCGGNLYLEEYTSDEYVARFAGFDLKCLLCSRVERTVSASELVLAWGVHPRVVVQARWATLTFAWRVPDAPETLAVEEMALAG